MNKHSGTTKRFLLTVLAISLFCLPFTNTAPASEPPQFTKGDVEELMQQLSNWGRWGKNDQLGALNFITKKTRRKAAKLVDEGISVSLARNTDKTASADNSDPFEHKMSASGADPVNGQWCADNYSVSYHGYAHTHIDSLCHVFYGGKMFNGFPQTEVSDQGAPKLSIHNLKEGIFARGILMDIPRLKGLDYLEPGQAIYPEDLEAWEKKARIRVSRGDVLLIRTGRWSRRQKTGPWDMEKQGSAGLHVSCAKWLKDREIAILGSDAASDVLPSGVDGVSHPIHLLSLNSMGIHILDNCDFEALSSEAARQRRWKFLLTAAPIPVTGGTGSPLNPIATF